MKTERRSAANTDGGATRADVDGTVNGYEMLDPVLAFVTLPRSTKLSGLREMLTCEDESQAAVFQVLSETSRSDHAL